LAGHVQHRPFEADLDAVVEIAADAFRSLNGANVFITGGTGFVGSWLLETFTWAVDRLALDAQVTVLSRDPDAFAAKAPHLAAHRAVRMIAGDVRSFAPLTDTVDLAIHAATPASAALNEAAPAEMVSIVVDGMRHVLDRLSPFGTIPMLFTSSGAVYGLQPPELSHVPETYLGAPDPLDVGAAYHEAKRVAELLCATATASGGPRAKIARLFAFVGPYLPIDAHFAVGNFMRDALDGGPIVVGGDGTPFRSYLYASDMAAWCWRILVDAPPVRAFNVGSEHAVDIAGIARAVASAVDEPVEVEVRGTPRPGVAPSRYVPSTERARVELGLEETVGFDDAMRRTVQWHRSTR
jgi:dTDP-glucose 4,6-dehydratase